MTSRLLSLLLAAFFNLWGYHSPGYTTTCKSLKVSCLLPVLGSLDITLFQWFSLTSTPPLLSVLCSSIVQKAFKHSPLNSCCTWVPAVTSHLISPEAWGCQPPSTRVLFFLLLLRKQWPPNDYSPGDQSLSPRLKVYLLNYISSFSAAAKTDLLVFAPTCLTSFVSRP